MKILIAADPHVNFADNLDSFKKFYEFAKSRNPDAIALLGDLSGFCFDNEDIFKLYDQLYSRIRPIVEQSIPLKYGLEFDNLSPYEIVCQTPAIAEYIHSDSPYGFHRKWKEVSEVYMELLSMFSNQARLAYVPIADVLKNNREKTMVIPGNHDFDLDFTVLKELSIHKQSIEKNSLKLSGYGGAAMRDGTPVFSGLPPELTTPFNEYPITSMNEDGTLETRLVSEPMEFLEQEQPDIALLHTPIYGLLDLPANLRDNNEMPEAQKHLGSPGIREYAMTGKTKIFFSGHVHSDPGVKSFEAKNGSIVVAMNPGCLGNTEVRGGHFAEVLIDDNTKEFQSATFYEILPGGLVAPSATYVKRGRTIEPIIVTGAMPSDDMADSWLMEERAKKIRFR
ncbi:MAG: metallophosphoesterase [Candidatus Nanoarchaeia archaeon]|jgi:Icc-related predicted phosphoesterase